MTDNFNEKALNEAEARYLGPRMYAGTTTDREISAFAEGALWASRHISATKGEATALSYEEIEKALAPVIANASFHPNPVAVLGRDVTELRRRCTAAIHAAMKEKSAEPVMTRETFLEHYMSVISETMGPTRVLWLHRVWADKLWKRIFDTKQQETHG